MQEALGPDVVEAPAGDFGPDDLFKLSLDLLCIATVDGRWMRVNPAVEKTLGYAAEELVSRPFFDFIHPDDLERTRGAMRQLVAARSCTSSRTATSVVTAPSAGCNGTRGRGPRRV
jgi:PAS domain-containing protein